MLTFVDITISKKEKKSDLTNFMSSELSRTRMFRLAVLWISTRAVELRVTVLREITMDTSGIQNNPESSSEMAARAKGVQSITHRD